MADTPANVLSRANDGVLSRRKVVVVLGMHRSGTSAFTRILNLMGADISANIMPGLKDNNDPGFWESLDVYEIQESLLREATGESWDSSAAFPSEWFKSPMARLYKDRLLAKLERDFASSSFFVLKDPRICRMAPFWLDIFSEFDADPYFVLPLRNPLEVARSLKVRDNFHFSKSYLMWLRHNLDAERDTRGQRRCFTMYEDLLTDWRTAMRRIFNNLELPEPELSPERSEEIERYLSSNWRHHVLSQEDVVMKEDLAYWIKDAYRVLVAAAKDEEEDLTSTLDRVREAYELAEIAYAPILADQALRVIEAKDKVEQTARNLEGIQAEYAFLRGLLEKREAALQTLVAEVSRLNQETIEQRHRIENLEAENEAIKHSSSWIVTKPLRALGRLVK